MSAINFELKKLWKQKAFLVIFIISVITTLTAIQTVSVPYYINGAVEEYNTIAFGENAVMNDAFSPLVGKEINGTLKDENEIKMYDLMNESRDLTQSYFDEKTLVFQMNDNNLSKDFISNLIKLNRNYFQLYTTYNIESTPVELENLEAQYHELNYMVNNDIMYEDLNFMQPTTSMIFRYSMEILFGIIPTIVLILFAAPFLSREIETGTIFSLKSQPYSRKWIIFSKFISLLVLTIYYVFLTLLSVFVLSKLLGYDLGHLNYPLRLFGSPAQLIPLWKYVMISSFYFVLFMGLIYLVSMAVGIILKKSTLTTILIAVFVILGILITTRVDSFKTHLNPFSLFDYRLFVLGNRVKIGTFYNPLTIMGNGLSLFPLLIILFILVLILDIFLIHKEIKISSNVFEITRKMSLHRFEFIKMNESNPIKFVSFLSVLLVFVLTLQLFIQDKVNEERILSVHYKQIEELEKLINAETDKSESNWTYQANVGRRDASQKILDDYNENNYNAFYKVNKTELDWYFQMYQRRGVIDDPRWKVTPQYEDDNPNYFTYAVSRQFVTEQKVRQINTNMPGYLQFTVYDNYVSNSARSLAMEKQYPIVMSGLNNLHQFNDHFQFEFVIIGLAVLFYGSGYVLDKENGNQVVMMLTQPLERFKFSMSKLITSIVAALCYSSMLILFVYLAGFIIGGHGQTQYPILYYDQIVADPGLIVNFEGSFGFMYLQDFIIRLIPLILMAVFFVVTLSQLLSLFFKNRIVLFVVVGSLCFIGFQLSINGYLGSIATRIPFTYLKASHIVDRSINVLINTNIINGLLATAVLGFYSVINIALYLEISQRKEMGGIK